MRTSAFYCITQVQTRLRLRLLVAAPEVTQRGHNVLPFPLPMPEFCYLNSDTQVVEDSSPPPPSPPLPGFTSFQVSLSPPLQHICKKQLNTDQHQMGELFVDNNNAYECKNCTCANLLSSLTPKLFSILFYPRRCW